MGKNRRETENSAIAAFAIRHRHRTQFMAIKACNRVNSGATIVRGCARHARQRAAAAPMPNACQAWFIYGIYLDAIHWEIDRRTDMHIQRTDNLPFQFKKSRTAACVNGDRA
jgi:hypothetical protein